MSPTISETLKTLAKDLNTNFPRSPREKLGGFVLAARMLDKCRAHLAGTNGEYHFNCPLDNMILGFSGIKADDFEALVASGATDEQVDAWIREKTQHLTREEIVRWNNGLLDKRISDLDIKLQLYFEDYIPQFIPKGRIIYNWFDVYDIEEKRM